MFTDLNSIGAGEDGEHPAESGLWVEVVLTARKSLLRGARRAILAVAIRRPRTPIPSVAAVAVAVAVAVAIAVLLGRMAAKAIQLAAVVAVLSRRTIVAIL